MNNITNLVSCALAAMAGIFFVSGLAVISGGNDV
jgi:hypothetical protein